MRDLLPLLLLRILSLLWPSPFHKGIYPSFPSSFISPESASAMHPLFALDLPSATLPPNPCLSPLNIVRPTPTELNQTLGPIPPAAKNSAAQLLLAVGDSPGSQRLVAVGDDIASQRLVAVGESTVAPWLVAVGDSTATLSLASAPPDLSPNFAASLDICPYAYPITPSLHAY
jgi:hypothetical protein